jgi:hypothetical protein
VARERGKKFSDIPTLVSIKLLMRALKVFSNIK